MSDEAVDEVIDEPIEYIECCAIQRRFIEAARARAAFVVDRPGAYFPNPRDRQTHIDIRASQEIAMAFCNMKDKRRQLGNTVDEVAKRCVDAEAGSKKQGELVTELQEQNSELKRRLGQVKGGKS